MDRVVIMEFCWSDDQIQLLLSTTAEFKAKCEFAGETWESKRSKYEKIHENFIDAYPENGGDSWKGKEKITVKRIGAKIKIIRSNYRKAVDSGRKSGGGRVVMAFFDLCETVWGVLLLWRASTVVLICLVCKMSPNTSRLD